MGQASEKAKQKLGQIGYYNLPDHFQYADNGIYISSSSPTVLKSYQVLLNPSDLESYTSHLQFRKMHQQSLVQIVYINVKQQQENYCKFTAYIENIPLRLQQTYSVHFNNMLKILYNCLKGFKILFEKYGYFTIDSSLIGVNNEGRPKCWVNKKYSEPNPKPSYSYKKMANPQNSMIQELKQVFRCQTDRNTIPHLFQLEKNSFEGLINEIINKYGQQWLNSRFQFNLVKQASIQNKTVHVAHSHSIHNVNPQIRFNYQMKQEPPKVVSSNRRAETSKSLQTSRKSNNKVNFSYQASILQNSSKQSQAIYK